MSSRLESLLHMLHPMLSVDILHTETAFHPQTSVFVLKCGEAIIHFGGKLLSVGLISVGWNWCWMA